MPTKNTKRRSAGQPPKRSEKPLRNSPAKRKAGRPPQANRAVTPEVLEQIGDMFLAGWKTSQIARKIGVDWSTVDHHLKLTIQPVWEAKLRQKAGIELAKVDLLERLAWQKLNEDLPGESRETVTEALTESGADLELVQRVTSKLRRHGSTAWAQIIEWCIETRCRLLGHFTPAKIKVEEEGYRVAGMRPEEVDAKMMKRLLEKVVEKQRRLAAIERGGNLN